MNRQEAIQVDKISKSFKIYQDKGKTLKERILFKNRRKYEIRRVLDNISFTVQKGESLGLIGHNGCGKSTMLKLLSRIMYPNSGKIKIRDRVSSLIELGAGFHPDMSGRENIYINASIFGLTRKEIKSRLDQIIEFAELGEYIDNPVRTYSSGMYARLAFAIAINVDADILLIDEILAVGDANFQIKCFERLREIKANGVTIIMVSHDLASIERLCDKAIWIESGKIIKEGKSSDVIDTYLKSMNQRRMKKLADNIIVTNESKSIEIDERKSSNNENRVGTREVEITNVIVYNQEFLSNTVDSSCEINIKITYKYNKIIDNCIFGIGILTIEGVRIFGTNTLLDRYVVRDEGKQGEIIISLQETDLLTGKYSLQVAITDQNGAPIDFYRDYLHFEVVNNSRCVGLINFKHKWKGVEL